MIRAAVVLATLTVAVGPIACSDPVEPHSWDVEPNCVQTYEFGNYGCTRVVTLIEPTAIELPASVGTRIVIRPAREDAGLTPYVDVTRTLTTSARVQLTRWSPGTGDTVSVWLVAVIYDRSNEPVNGFYPVIAADSVLRSLRIAPIGARAPVDTVRLAPTSTSSQIARRDGR